jgi:hypothetical protein
MIPEVPLYIVRHSQPTELDQLPKGTLCEVKVDSRVEVYEQQSDDTNNPKWVLKDLNKLL